MNDFGLHFTAAGLAAAVGLLLGVLRLIAAVKPWFAWRRDVDVRLASLEAAGDTSAMKDKLLS